MTVSQKKSRIKTKRYMNLKHELIAAQIKTDAGRKRDNRIKKRNC